MPSRTPPPQPPPLFTHTPSSLLTAATALITTTLTTHNTLISTLTPSIATFASLLLPLTHAENSLLATWRTLRIYQSASTDPDLRAASRKADDLLAAFELETKQRRDLFLLVDAVVNKGEVLGPEEEHLLMTIHRQMIKTGVALEGNKRERFAEIQKGILEGGSRFKGNVRDGSVKGVWFGEGELAGVPGEVIGGMDRDEEGRVFARFDRDVASVLRFADDAEARKRMYVGMYNTCNENVEVFKEVAVLRDEAARLLGYRNHAALVVEDRMAGDTETVHQLLGRLREGLAPGGAREMERYREEKRDDYEARGEEWDGRVYLWDLNYYGRRANAKEYMSDQMEIAEWFPLQTTVEGMLETMGHLFGLVFEEMRAGEAEREEMVWRDDVQIFSVWNSEDEGGRFLGYLYLDMYSYEFKGSGASCSSIIPGYLKPDGSRVYPSVALICDFARPTDTKPCLLSHMNVTMLFHELGHGIHDLVSKTKYARFHGSAGTVIDFGEAPSQVLENWFLIPSELKRLSRHYSSLSDDYLKTWREKQATEQSNADIEGEDIPPPEIQLPDRMIADLLRSKGLNRSLFQLNQLCMSIWDFNVHDQGTHEDLVKMNFSEAYNRLHREIYPPDDPSDLGEGFEWGHPYCTWTMLVQGDYHAGYYSYALSEVYSADIFDTFFKADPTSAAQGRKYRYGLLEPGGSRPEMETLLAFLGRKPNPEPFLRSLGIS